MFDELKKSMLDTAKTAVRSYNEGRYEIDAETRKAFDRLGLPYDSAFETIKKRYLLLSREFHPDTGSANNSDAFLAIKKAYDVLKSVKNKKGSDG